MDNEDSETANLPSEVEGEVPTNTVVRDRAAELKKASSKVAASLKTNAFSIFNWARLKVETYKKPKDLVVDPVVAAEEGKAPNELAVVAPTDQAITVPADKTEEEKKQDPSEVKPATKGGGGGGGEVVVKEVEEIHHSQTYLEFISHVQKVSPALADKLESYDWKLDPKTALWLEKVQAWLPRPPKSLIHAMLLYDKMLSKCVPHWLRFFVYSGLWHVFPFWYGSIRGAKLEGQCSEDLVPWMGYCASLSAGRMFGVGLLGAIRIRNRGWDGQNFGEAMGELINPMTDGAEDPDPCPMSGPRLTLIRVLYHLIEFSWMCVGWTFYTNIQICDNTIEFQSRSLLVYQTFNLIVFSVAVDFVWPYCYMEWQRDIDTTTKHKKKPPKKRIAKRKVAANTMDMMGMGMDDDDDDDAHKPKPQILLSADGTPDVNPYAEKKEDHKPPAPTVVDHHDKPKGDTAAQKAARQGAQETAKLWESLGDPNALNLNSVNDKKDEKLEKHKPVVSKAPLLRIGDAARKKIASKQEKVYVAGSKGTEWWRSDGAAPPRKPKGKGDSKSSTTTSKSPELEKKGSSKKGGEAERPSTSGGKIKVSPSKKSGKGDDQKSPAKGATKKINVRPSTAPK